jgi:hypothetical protein
MNSEQQVQQYLASWETLQNAHKRVVATADQLDEVAKSLEPHAHLVRWVVTQIESAATRLRKWQEMSDTARVECLNGLPQEKRSLLAECYDAKVEAVTLYEQLLDEEKAKVPSPYRMA